MRILLLTQYYAPEPAFKFADLARGLVARGHEVQVLTGFPCYPHGKTYPGYRQRLHHSEVVDGVLVTRVPQWPDHSSSVLRRVLYYATFALSAATIGWRKARRADVILAYQSALPIGLTARWLSFATRTPYVLDVADLWPESLAATGMIANRTALSVVARVMKFIYRGARRINVITTGYRDNLLRRGVPAEKLSVIETWPAAGLFDPLPVDAQLAASHGMTRPVEILYAGAMGPSQGLEVVLDAAANLADRPEIRFTLVGDGLRRASLEAAARSRGLANVQFVGRLDPSELRRLYPSASALLVHLTPNDMSRASIPSKTFACMCSGRPLLMGCEGVATELVRRHACGLCFTPGDAESLAAAVTELADMAQAEQDRLAANARSAYLQFYQSSRQIDRYVAFLSEAIGAPVPAATPTPAPRRPAAA
ncbi:MAG: glycosyltransferase family 4 protein [Pirellulales bacterium]|nr:glycosyltransferase family 4 protein [Pirellulales bacterium]